MAKKRPTPPQRGGLEAVNVNIAELLSKHRKVTQALLAALAVVVLEALVIVVMAVTRPHPQYFAVTPDLRVTRLAPLDQPLVSNQGIEAWVTETVATTLGLDWKHWRATIAHVQDRYTPEAFASLLKSLSAGGTLDVIKQQRLDVGVAIPNAPIILGQWVYKGTRYWKVQFPLVLSFDSSKGTVSTQSLTATVIVKRVPATQSPRGVLIAQVVIGSNNS